MPHRLRSAAAVAAALVVGLGAAAGCSGGDDESAFCDRMAATASVDAALERFDPLDPAGTAATFAEAADRLDRLADAAPSEVEDAARRIADAVAEVVAALRVVHRDDPNGALAALDRLSDPAGDLAAAGAELEAYAADRCGTTLGSHPTTTAPPAPTTAPATVTAPTTATTATTAPTAPTTAPLTTPPGPSEG